MTTEDEVRGIAIGLRAAASLLGDKASVWSVAFDDDTTANLVVAIDLMLSMSVDEARTRSDEVRAKLAKRAAAASTRSSLVEEAP